MQYRRKCFRDGTLNRKRRLRIEGLENRQLLAVVAQATTDANALRDAILGDNVQAIGNAALYSGSTSAGVFTGGGNSIGIESGIVLSTGDVEDVEGPNTEDLSSGVSTNVGYEPLDELFGVQTADSTVLEFDFELTDDEFTLRYVFASEEYNQFVNTTYADVFGVFLDGEILSLVPGTSTPVSVNTVNAGNPVGTGGPNS